MLQIPYNNLQQRELQERIYFLEETAAVTGTGSYRMNIVSGECFVDEIGRSVLNIPSDLLLNFKSCQKYILDKVAAQERLDICLNGGSFECDTILCDHNNVQFWAKTTGSALFDNNDRLVGIKGIFTSIDRFVKKSKEVELHARIIEAQKDRLVDFADIVSHNLRSHASNLQLTLETFDETVEPRDLELFKGYLKDISDNINRTLRHLNAVVTTHTVEQQFEQLSLEEELNKILELYKKELQDGNVTINVDFTAFDAIYYVRLYLVSILKNILSNAVRYKHPDRDCVIDIRTKMVHDKKLLVIKDNGSGVDLNKYGDKIFKMYNTFHGNENARGLGLFIVKNQVESVNGDISISSQLDKGTSITVRF